MIAFCHLPHQLLIVKRFDLVIGIAIFGNSFVSPNEFEELLDHVGVGNDMRVSAVLVIVISHTVARDSYVFVSGHNFLSALILLVVNRGVVVLQRAALNEGDWLEVVLRLLFLLLLLMILVGPS